jgi:hypothetical protein
MITKPRITLIIFVALILTSLTGRAQEKICPNVQKIFQYLPGDTYKYEMTDPDGNDFPIAYSTSFNVTYQAKIIFTPTKRGVYTLYRYQKILGIKYNRTPEVEFDTEIHFKTSSQPSIYCGDVTTLSVSHVNDNTLTYYWAAPVSSSSSSVTVDPKQNTTYSVTATDVCGSSLTKDVSVTVNPFPVNVTQDAYQCPGGSFTLTASGASTYSWSPQANIFPVTGSTVTGSIVNNGTGLQLPIYNVTGYRPGCPPVTASAKVIIYSPTIATPVVTGPTGVCVTNGSNIFSYINSDMQYSDIIWSIGNGLNTVANLSGTSGNSATVAINPNAPENSVFDIGVKVKNRCGVTSNTGSMNVNVARTAPASAPIMPSGPSSVCNSGQVSTYTLGGMVYGAYYEITPSNAVATSTTSTYGMLTVDWNNSFTGTANIRARIQNGCGASPWSGTTTVSIINGTCREAVEIENSDYSENPSVSIYPNPSKETASILINDANFQNSRIEIYDITGKIVYTSENIVAGTEILIGESIDPGVYTVKVISGEKVKSLKFVKEN